MLTDHSAIGLVERIAAMPPMKQTDDYEKDGILHCARCGEPKQAWIDWFPDADGNPRKNLVRVMCKCDLAEEQREKDRKAQDKFDENMRLIRLVLHTQRDDVRWRFDMDDDPANPVARTCREYVERWDEMKADNMGILLYGSKGNGKTFYASSIYNALKAKRVLVGFTTAPNLMDILSEWDKAECLEAITKPQLLVIDDLGAERETSYSAELMHLAIDARYKTGKPTIVTTNLDKSTLEQEEDLWRSRIYDRVIEMCPIAIPMTGKSRRGAIADARKAKAREILDWTKGDKMT